MRGVLNRELLEGSDWKSAIVWRYIRDNPSQSRSKIADGTGMSAESIRSLVQWLKERGWVISERWGKTASYRVSFNGVTKDEEPKVTRPRAKNRLTRLAARAKKARHSAITIQMSKALAEIEVEARRIRDGL